MDELKQAAGRKSSFLQTLAAGVWSLIGVRKRQDHERDKASLNPVHVIITGVMAGVLFVVTLVVLVRVILG